MAALPISSALGRGDVSASLAILVTRLAIPLSFGGYCQVWRASRSFRWHCRCCCRSLRRTLCRMTAHPTVSPLLPSALCTLLMVCRFRQRMARRRPSRQHARAAARVQMLRPERVRWRAQPSRPCDHHAHDHHDLDDRTRLFRHQSVHGVVFRYGVPLGHADQNHHCGHYDGGDCRRDRRGLSNIHRHGDGGRVYKHRLVL